MSENEQVNEKDRENFALLQTNKMLNDQLVQANRAKESMEGNLMRVYSEAHEVKAMLDAELKEYEATKDSLSSLRRQNLVLWEHIKKIYKKMRKARAKAKRQKHKMKKLSRVHARAQA